MLITEYYVAYPILCAALIAGLARALHWAGDVFLRDSFRNRPDIVRAVGRLLDIGFYLVSFGYLAVTLINVASFNTWIDLADSVATKFGILLMLLGFLHIFNLLILALFRGRREPAPAVS